MLALTYDAGFAQLADLKKRLQMSAGQTDRDAELTDFLIGVSQTMENYAGFPLLRRHAITEYPRGGGPLIKLGAEPIVAVHSIRESDDRDFETAANYEELVEGTDFVIEPTRDGQPDGESGILRRLNANWLGSASDPKKVRVIYTAGYKTDDENDADNTETQIQEATLADDWDMIRVDSPFQHTIASETEEEINLALDAAGRTSLAIVRFNTSKTILRSWKAVSATLAFSAKKVSSSSVASVLVMHTPDPLSPDMAAVFSGALLGTAFGSASISQTFFTRFTITTSTDAALDVINKSILAGFVAFVFRTTLAEGKLAAIENASPSDRPALTIVHRNVSPDLYTVPDDLRHQCLIQATHDYRTRTNPGLLSESARGIQVASGSSYNKNPAELLPSVKAALDFYRGKRLI